MSITMLDGFDIYTKNPCGEIFLEKEVSDEQSARRTFLENLINFNSFYKYSFGWCNRNQNEVVLSVYFGTDYSTAGKQFTITFIYYDSAAPKPKLFISITDHRIGLKVQDYYETSLYGDDIYNLTIIYNKIGHILRQQVIGEL